MPPPIGRQTLGIPVATTTEIHRKPEHPPEALARAREVLESLDEWGLAVVQSVTMECKSLLIALALVFRNTTVEKVLSIGAGAGGGRGRVWLGGLVVGFLQPSR